ncbi:anti-repressor SinI family protein [Metabacillus sediminilitoris]|uniref:DNA-binding anti-repressor SinI n=1 Tax=Metabacillus sediminilitoris TaxID=2567941 RepID=A0A4S4BKN7_9BACI|nr:anti-repressor SinI family protein [Metabacillus sediminilitoris]QGQ45896.1 DNA-binding anti-repressor SinI [Metabacillus sediminilitoris]THF75078.1 DNA-binding anti-repressor SinI [Metabacillus sediminilitoris]
MNQKSDEIILDKEWEELILSALEIGITIEEIRDFFNKYPSPK